MLASTEGLDPDAPKFMVGANMAFSRRVLEKVPSFDTELGPGALGFFDESLFSGSSSRRVRLGSALDVWWSIIDTSAFPVRLCWTRSASMAAPGLIEHHWEQHDQSRPAAAAAAPGAAAVVVADPARRSAPLPHPPEWRWATP
ncbi:MAG: hypothetical protein FRX48_09193 [Lasallia pustulata]|uniref:Uncharacterized protein n=1 Tax=Lasallia pustulata TaxID=136370 RepID=A0A5M8PCT5_9LECA|nr:MAG: hypothetical protein FRX48_09193 [Lasallia pustulata]